MGQLIDDILAFSGGLSLVYRIIDKYLGKIWAEAKKGEGATFWFTLPTTQD
jgi:signal transduction histidine kinase